MIPAGAFLVGFQTDFLGRVSLQEIEDQMTQDGEVLGGVSGADPAPIFAEADIQRPMQRVLDGPVATHGAGEGGRVGPDTTEIEAPLGGELALILARAFDHPNRAQVSPLVVSREPGNFFGDPVAARLASSVPHFAGFQEVVSHTGKTVDPGIFEETLHLPMQAAPWLPLSAST